MEERKMNNREDNAKGVIYTDPKTGETKRVNKSWVAFMESQGCFEINDPKFCL